MARATFEYEELLADLAERRRQLAAISRERDGLASQLRIANEALEAEQHIGQQPEVVEFSTASAAR